MITVTPAHPPRGFTSNVVKRAKVWASREGWLWSRPPPPKKAHTLPDYWRWALDSLHNSYGGVCAYLSVYTHRALSATSVDHFVPKSVAPIRQTYDWANYRLASRQMNTNKGDYRDVLDPFTLPPGLFELDLLSGRVRINLSVAPLNSPLNLQARATIRRLKLNASVNRDLRVDYLNNYLHDKSALGSNQARLQLLRQSPFLHAEVVRQGW